MIGARFEVRDLVSPKLRLLAASLRPGPERRSLMGGLGKVLEVELRSHFLRRNQEPNKRGWAKQQFWEREVRDKTSLAAVTDEQATVTIASRPFRAKVFGAVIRPGPGRKFLAIPAREEAYGKRASSQPVPGLFPIFRKGGSAAAGGYLVRKVGPRLEIWYRLRRQTRVPRDPRALPDMDRVADQIESKGSRLVAALVRRRMGR